MSQKYSDKSQVPKPTLSAVTHAFTVTGTTPCHTTRTGICKRIVNLIANAFRRRQPNKPAYISDIYMPLLSATMFSIIRELPHLKAHKYYLSPCTQLLPSVTACQCPAPGLDRRYAAVPAGLRAYYNKATVGLGPGRRYSSLKARGRSCICILYSYA